jgi:hypothetical protein
MFLYAAKEKKKTRGMLSSRSILQQYYFHQIRTQAKSKQIKE